MYLFRLLFIITLICALQSCSSKSNEFTVEGKIIDADSSVLYLEKRELNNISILDSTKLNKKGDFKFKYPSTPYPEFYILRLDNQVINFAVDSTETVRIEANKRNFATDYKVEESTYNHQIQEVVIAQNSAENQINSLKQQKDKNEINDEQYRTQVENALKKYKEIAQKIIYSNFKSPAAYFALFQKVDDFLFFNVYNKSDNKLFGAVATSWDQYYKDSPRTTQIKDYTLIAMKVIKQSNQEIAKEVLNNVNIIESGDYYKIELPNTKDQIVSLSSLKGKIVLLDFTLYGTEESPAHNIALNKLYDKFKPNLEIYQVAFDPDTHLWKNAAINLPWVTVHESRFSDSDLFTTFNIGGLPTLFLVNKNGEIVKRILPTDDIESEIYRLIQL